MACGIYKIQNKVNGKVYIGSSKNIEWRWNNHISSLDAHSPKCNRILQIAWDKYGEDNFIFEIVEECPEELLIERESYWIKFYDSKNKEKGYNIRNPEIHEPLHQETKKRISESLKTKYSEDRLKGKRHVSFGKSISEEHKMKISKSNRGPNNGMYGKETSLEVKQKISKSVKESYDRSKLPKEKYEEIVKLLKNGVFQKDIVNITGISLKIVRSISQGVHWSIEYYK